MRLLGIPRMDRFAPSVLVAMVAIAFVPMGCGPLESDRLVVATSWPLPDRLRIETKLAEWLATSGPSGLGRVRLDWLILRPGDDPGRLAVRRNPPDVLLGGPAASFDRLAQMNQLSPLPLEGSPNWSVARRSWIRLAGPSTGTSGKPGPTGQDNPIIAIDDPRDDPISLAWAKGLVRDDQFREGYSQLVRVAGHRASNGPSSWLRAGRGRAR